MADQRYYPYVPWDDVPVQGDIIDRDRIHADTWLKEGIYGPYAQIFKWLSARDNKQLVADSRIIGTLQTA